jgi:hypothetical protein
LLACSPPTHATPKAIVYPVAAAAVEHGAGVDEQTTRSADAYAKFPQSTRSRYRDGWLPDFPY